MTLFDDNLDKFDYLIGFVNDIAEIVSDPEELLDPNTGDSSALSIGYWTDLNGNITLSDIEGDESVTAFNSSLEEILNLVKSNIKTDFSKKWEELRGE